MPKVRNAFLSVVEDEVLSRFSAKLTPVHCQRGQDLQRPGEALEWVYFPETAIAAAAAETDAGESLNVVLVGAEGVIGGFEACGSRRVVTRITVQVAGRACRISAGHYRDLYDESPALRTAIHKYTEFTLFEARQLIACNALHTVEARLSRVLLEAADRGGENEIVQVTQEALAHILGVQRTTVAASIAALQRLGLIRTGRGAITLENAPGLERASCSCRSAIASVKAEIYATSPSSCEA